MGKEKSPEYKFINRMIEEAHERQARHEKTNCSRHGLTNICTKCRRCLSCRDDESGENSVVNDFTSKCWRCFYEDYIEYNSRT